MNVLTSQIKSQSIFNCLICELNSSPLIFIHQESTNYQSDVMWFCRFMRCTATLVSSQIPKYSIPSASRLNSPAVGSRTPSFRSALVQETSSVCH